MRKISTLLTAALFVGGASAFAQADGPVLFNDLMGYQISSNGKYVVLGEVIENNYVPSIYNVSDGIINTYTTASFLGEGGSYNLPAGNCVTDDGKLLGLEPSGNNILTALIGDGVVTGLGGLEYIPGKNEGYNATAISADGSTICGYYRNPETGIAYPFVYNTLTGETIQLPAPTTDFWGEEIYLVEPMAISENGNIIAGLVRSSQYFMMTYDYPIIFSANGKGEWSYTLPSKNLAGEDASSSAQFQRSLAPALSQDGNILVVGGEYEGYDWDNDSPSGNSTFYVFDPDGTYETITSSVSGLTPYQVLNDGTILAVTKQGYLVDMYSFEDGSLQNSYILLPGAQDFVSFIDYLSTVAPAYAEWINENCQFEEEYWNDEIGGNDTRDVVVSGKVSVSEDLNSFLGGIKVLNSYYPSSAGDFEYTSYFMTTAEEEDTTGVASIGNENNGIYRVYNLQGVKVMEGKDLNGLANGIYIINGKKVVIRN